MGDENKAPAPEAPKPPEPPKVADSGKVTTIINGVKTVVDAAPGNYHNPGSPSAKPIGLK